MSKGEDPSGCALLTAVILALAVMALFAYIAAHKAGNP